VPRRHSWRRTALVKIQSRQPTSQQGDTGAPIQRIARQYRAYYHESMRTISLKLTDNLLAQLAKAAKARRVTRSSLVRESLEKALHEQPSPGEVSCYDLARDLAGSVKGLPKDLANDPKYMEGFGR
jgi:hypothetical protein